MTPEPTPGTPADPVSVPAPSRPPRHRSVMRDSLLIVVPILLVLGGVAAYLYWGVYRAVGTVEIPDQIRQGLAVADALDPEYTAAGDELVAAPPTDPKKQIDGVHDPENDRWVLRLGVLDEVDNPKKPEVAKAWAGFVRHLEETINAGETEKTTVELVRAPVPAREAASKVKAGDLHVLAMTTGAVPWLVNHAGVVPFAVPADDQGKFGYHVEILVRSDSPVKSLHDLKGKKIHLGSFSSLSSFKAPLVVLWENAQFVPGRDYEFSVTSSRDAIRGLIWGDYEVVAVASDFLSRIEAEERNKAETEKKDYPKEPYRSIYQSEVTYPPFCFGHVHNLEPKLAEKVQKAFVSFRFAGTGLESAYKDANQTRFVAVNYKDDWKQVRELDRKLADFVGVKKR